MEKINYKIYKLIDPVSNEIRYIGLTFNTLKQRLGSHYSDPGKTHKCNWIRKLKSQGLKPIIESVEENISSYEEVCEKEIYYIEYFKNIGCNLTNIEPGGGINKKISDETKKKMSISAKSRNFKLVLTDEQRLRLSISAIEKFKDDNEREKLRISNKRYENSKTEMQKLNDILIQNNKFVYQYDKDMNLINKFTSIRDVERQTGISRTNVSKCCKHKVRMVGGFVWRFDGDLTPPEYKKGHVSVIQYDMYMNFIKEYKNSNVAANELNLNSSNILSCCKVIQKSSGGFKWSYKNEISI